MSVPTLSRCYTRTETMARVIARSLIAEHNFTARDVWNGIDHERLGFVPTEEPRISRKVIETTVQRIFRIDSEDRGYLIATAAFGRLPSGHFMPYHIRECTDGIALLRTIAMAAVVSEMLELLI